PLYFPSGLGTSPEMWLRLPFRYGLAGRFFGDESLKGEHLIPAGYVGRSLATISQAEQWPRRLCSQDAPPGRPTGGYAGWYALTGLTVKLIMQGYYPRLPTYYVCVSGPTKEEIDQ